MLVPKKVRVAGHKYNVIIDNDNLHNEGLAGDAFHAGMLIRLCDTLPDGKSAPHTFVEDTFLHEVLHCVDVQYNNGQLPEDQVRRLATGLQQVLGDLGWIPREKK